MIDVIIPAYNAEKFILEAIKSVEGQTLKPDNIFVINDGSTDNTEKIIEGYKNISIIPITYISKENGGPNSARNMGLSLSKTEFVAFLDADDIWIKDKLEKQVIIFNNKKYSNIGLVYGGYDVINADGIKDEKGFIVPIDENVKGNAFIPLLDGNKILGSASNVLIKKEVFEKVGLFDENLHFGEDWDMWLRIAEKYDLDFSLDTLVHIRRHKSNQTNNLDNVFLGEIDFFNKWSVIIQDKYPTPKRWADQIAFHILTKILRFRFLNKALNKLTNTSKKVIFNSTFNSPILYSFIFLFKKLTNPKDWSYMISKIKRYV